jgi:outer membrane protein assembly factor BamB
MPTAAPNPIGQLPGTNDAKRLPDAARRALRASLALTAWAGGVFCLVVCVTMLCFHFSGTTSDPWKSPQLLALKERLVTEPNNEQLKEQIRGLDAEYRRKFRRRLNLDHSGGWLLLGGALVLLASARSAINLNRRLDIVPPKADAEAQAMRLATLSRWSVAGAGALVSVGLLLVALAANEDLPKAENVAPPRAGAAQPAIGAPTLAEFQANYPRFRGWDGGGFSTQSNTALSWDAKTGAGIAWKTAVLSPGHNSPVVWSNRVFISGATASRREVFAYDTADGRLLWRRAIENVPGSAPAPDISEDTGYAASTTATDGRFIYAIFANGDLAALSFSGEIAWAKAFGPLKNAYGHATSLAIWPGKLLVQLDQGEAVAANSRLLALEPASGRVLWESRRPVTASWATPIVIEAAGRQLIVTLGAPWVIAYSCEDGAELWRADLLENEVVPSPVSAGGLVFAVSPSSRLMALRLDGAGDVTKTAVVWTNEESVPDITSPVSNGELVFTATSGGDLACFDAKTGTKVWAQDLQMTVNASPAIVGGRLFVLGLEGVAVVAEAGRQFKEIARTQLPDRFIASPAFANSRMFLRGETNLYCIEPPPGAGAKAP